MALHLASNHNQTLILISVFDKHCSDRVQPVPNVASQWQPWLWPWGGRPNPRGILAPPHCKLNMIMPCADQWSPSLFLIQYLQLVYEFFLRFLESPDFQPSIGLNIHCLDDPYLFQGKKWSIKSLFFSCWNFLTRRTPGDYEKTKRILDCRKKLLENWCIGRVDFEKFSKVANGHSGFSVCYTN